LTDVIIEADELLHYGTPRHSGRYPWGSGKTPMERGRRSFLEQHATLKRQGLSDPEIAKGLGFSSTTDLRAKIAIAKDEHRRSQATLALRLNEKGMSNVAIGRQMGLNESSVRALLDPANAAKRSVLDTTSSFLKDQVDSGGYLDIGKGTENWRGISSTKLSTAVAMLKQQGYVVHNVQVPQLGTTGGKKTTIKVLAPPGTTYVDVKTHPERIKTVAATSPDHGRTIDTIKPPVAVDPKRVSVRWAEDGGGNADGIIYVRPGVPDVSLGDSAYAQVRIKVGPDHYLKGMAVYKDGLPAGTDLQFNTNKRRSDNKLDAMKPVGDDPVNPFGSAIRQKTWTDRAGRKRLSPMNIVNEEGDWRDWSRSLSSQVLSKQNPQLAKRQLDLAFHNKADELEEIMRLTNPVIKHKLLMTFGDSADSAAVHLKAAAMPGQKTHVIIPIEGVKSNQIYAPNYNNGERVVLIRHPHGGTFEIPELTVNNRTPLAKATLGHAPDAVGIHPSVAKRLSGADFDGDTVLVIPNKRGDIKTTESLASLNDFDPITHYAPFDGMRTIDGGTYNAKTGKVDFHGKNPKGRPKQQKMGDVSNLITDMTIKGADRSEIARAVKHSMVVIDSEKHHLNVQQSYEDNGIRQLKAKYQGLTGSGRRVAGASTIISRAGSEIRVAERRPRPASKGGAINPVTGQREFEKTGATTVDRQGRTIIKTRPSKRLAEAVDARTLLSDSPSPMEEIYAAHSNSMKGLANRARLASLQTGRLTYSPSAAKVYRNEVASLTAKLGMAKKNAPLERKAQLVANQIVAARLADNPHIKEDPDAYKKLKGISLEQARDRVGAKKKMIKITPEEWRAIQSGAISTNRLSEIIDNANIDELKKLATPRTKPPVTAAKMVLARTKLASGYTQAEVAKSLGISVSTLNAALKSEGG
jgi:DNA-binding CsgD family transcriptional regulator